MNNNLIIIFCHKSVQWVRILEGLFFDKFTESIPFHSQRSFSVFVELFLFKVTVSIIFISQRPFSVFVEGFKCLPSGLGIILNPNAIPFAVNVGPFLLQYFITVQNLHAMHFAVLVGGFPLRIVLIVGNRSASKRFSLTFDILYSLTLF